MDAREQTARAIAFFEECDDIALLHQLVAEIAPRARRMVAGFLARGTEEIIPPPAELRAARSPASRDEALKTVRTLSDFGLLQVVARAIGQRAEAIEIVASAEFPEGARVQVPDAPRYPRSNRLVGGEVEATGMSLTVRLDNGETWQGPASLAQRAGPG
jgi:hypothetical protein